eukprot:COSAG01_NODE_15601_length_1320_cov_1.821458_1_plen_396_part_01
MAARSGGAGHHANNTPPPQITRLPVIPTPHAFEGGAGASAPAAGGGERRAGQQQQQQQGALGQPQEGLSTHVDMVERVWGEYQVMLQRKDDQLAAVLAQHREDLRRKDDQHRDGMRLKDEQHREDMRRKDEQLAKKDQQMLDTLAKKDEQLAKKDEQHREDMRMKDEHLDRLMHQLSGGGLAARASPAPVLQLHQTSPKLPMMPAAPSAQPPAAPSPQHQARRVQPLPDKEAPPPPPAPAMPVSDGASSPPPPSTDALAAQLQGGGDGAEAALVAVLECALQTLEAVLMSTPRKQRKALKAQCERAEVMLEELGEAVVGRLASCEAAELRALSEQLCTVQALRIGTDEVGMACIGIIRQGLDELEQCSNVVVGSSRQLGSVETHVRRLGLEALAGL